MKRRAICTLFMLCCMLLLPSTGAAFSVEGDSTSISEAGAAEGVSEASGTSGRSLLSAVGAAPAATVVSILNESANRIIQNIKTSISTQNGDLADMKSKMQRAGSTLFALLAVIVLTWRGIEAVLEQGVLADVMGRTLRTIFMVGIAYWFAQPDGLFHWISSAGDWMAGSGGDPTQAVSLMSGMVAKIVAFMDQQASAGNGFVQFLKLLAGPIFLGILACIFCLVAIVIAVGMYAMSLMLMLVAGMFAPLAIPLMMHEKTSHMFSGWVSFTLTAALYKPVLAIFMLCGTGALNNAIGTYDSALSWAQLIGVSISMAATAGLMVYMMMQVGSVASGIFSSGVSMSFPAGAMRRVAGAGAAAGQGLGAGLGQVGAGALQGAKLAATGQGVGAAMKAVGAGAMSGAKTVGSSQVSAAAQALGIKGSPSKSRG